MKIKLIICKYFFLKFVHILPINQPYFRFSKPTPAKRSLAWPEGPCGASPRNPTELFVTGTSNNGTTNRRTSEARTTIRSDISTSDCGEERGGVEGAKPRFTNNST